MKNVLDEIVSRTLEDLDRDPIDAAGVERAAKDVVESSPSHRFRSALTDESSVNVIAEIKAASPSAGPIMLDPPVERIAGNYERGGAAAISVVTEPHFFHGSRDWLGRAREASGLPVLMKDFVVVPEQVLRGIAAGADAILLLASILDQTRLRHFVELCREYGRDALVEVHDEEELAVAIEAGAEIIGVNSRNLGTFEVDLAVAERLSAGIPPAAIRVAESGIRSREDVVRLEASGYHAFLVGETLMRDRNSSTAIAALRGRNVEARS
jgi:indole-3-glycerol phosphate synthase